MAKWTRRRWLGAAASASALVAVRATAQAPVGLPSGPRVPGMLPAISPVDFGAYPGAADVTLAIERMMAAMGGSAATGRYQSRWPNGVYNVIQVRFDLAGATHNVDGAILVGVSRSPKASIVDIRGAHSWIRGLKVVGNFSTSYACGVHHYSNDLTLHYPGFIDLIDLQVEACAIGLVIGALPMQKTIPGQAAHEPDDVAINAPLSELVYTNPRFTNCPRGLYMRQPNGKVTVVGGRINSESGAWRGAFPVEKTFAVALADPGSELNLVGGTLEHVQGEGGVLALVTEGRLVVTDAAIETTVPSYIDNTGVLIVDRVANNGINSQTRAYVEIGPNASGSLSLSRCAVGYPPGHIDRTDGAALIQSVTGPGGGYRPHNRFIASFASVEIRDPAIAFSGERYLPLVRGVHASFSDCTLVALDGKGVRRASWRLDDGDDRFGGVIDRSGKSLPAFPSRELRCGGWSFTFGGNGAAMGVGEAPPESGPLGQGHALRLSGGTAGMSATTPAIPVKRDSLMLLRAMVRTGPGSARIVFRAHFFDFAGVAMGETALFAGSQAEFGEQWQPLLLPINPPVGAERCKIALLLDKGAEVQLAVPSLR